jgi:hypothetical protein
MALDVEGPIMPCTAKRWIIVTALAALGLAPLTAEANPYLAMVFASAKKRAARSAYQGPLSPYQRLHTVRSWIRSNRPQVREVVRNHGGPVKIFHILDFRLFVTETGRLAYQSRKRPDARLRRVFFGWQVSSKKFFGLTQQEVNDTFFSTFVYRPNAEAREAKTAGGS